jgi:tRNA threonylcarbamoyladenosine biosynthesis protein TsaB
VKRLALDTSSVACTVALRVGDQLIERHEEKPREHTRLLMPMIREVLKDADIELSDLDCIVLGNGPGSFIGMRIAASVAQGLAFGANLNIVPVSSLAAVAAEVFDKSDVDRVAVAQDAHMNEVYLGLYSRRSDNLPQPVIEERLQGQSQIDEFREVEPRYTIAGQGWQRYPDLAVMNEQWIGKRSDVLLPRAAYLLTLSELSEAINPIDIEPAYLRQKVAQVPGSAPATTSRTTSRIKGP